MGTDESGGAERRLLQAARAGALLNLQAGDHELDDPAHGAAWGADRTIRAEFLVELLTGERTTDTVRLRSVKLRGARITGHLDLEAAEFVCPLLLWDCRIEQPINLSEAVAPAVRLPGCHLPGLIADQLRTTGNLELNQGLTVEGEITLSGAHIGGNLDLDGARLSNPAGRVLSARGLTVRQDMPCRDGFSAEGEVHLVGAHVGGTLSFGGARLTNPGGRALSADRLSADLDVFFQDDFVAEGEVRLPGARIRGLLALTGARFINPGGRALSAEALIVDQGIVGREGFTAEGETHLVGAHVGYIDLSGATLANPTGLALFADGLTVDQGMFCRDGFTAEGEIRLVGACIGDRLSFRGASLTNSEALALDLEAVSANALILRFRRRPDRGVDLTNAQVGLFSDDQATWPVAVSLRGFTYDTLENDDVDVRSRLRWLALHPDGYAPQIYDQLAAAYGRAGHEGSARQVALAKQWHRRKVLSFGGKLVNWLLYLTVGYGYRTWLAVLWLAALLAFGTGVFASGHAHHMFRAGNDAPPFHAFAYTLDVLLPVVDLGQQKAWRAQGAAMYWSWVLIAAGWVLTTAVVAGLTGILKRD